MSVTLAGSTADPWSLELIVVARARRTGAERGAIARDVHRGLLIRVLPGVYVERTAFEALTLEQAHIVRMRALAASSPGQPVFSHHSAAVLHGLPVLRSRLDRVHVTAHEDDDRHRVGVTAHLFDLTGEPARIGGLLTTDLGRTVVDVAGAGPMEEGVMVADAALRRGIPRAVLDAAVLAAGERRASRRISEVVAFANPGGESAAESRMRVTAYRIGVEVPQLQREFRVGGGSVFADAWFPLAAAVLEVDGDSKYLSGALAPRGAGPVVLAEKRREDGVRAQVRAFGRVGWAASGSVATLRPVLARIGVRPSLPRTTFAAWCAVAREARPRRP